MKLKWAILFLFIIFIFVRVIHLDSDVPNLKVVSYSTIDELYYSMGGFNLFHYGHFVNSQIPYAELDSTPFVFSLDSFTYFTLRVFGNNYFGLRMASVLCSALIFILVVVLLLKIKSTKESPDSLKDNLLVLAILLFFTLDYGFLIESRIAEPGIYRSLIIVLLVYVFSKYHSTRSKNIFFFIVGFISFGSVLFVYLYNVFVILAVGLSILYLSFQEKERKRSMFKFSLFFILGGIVSLCLFELFVRMAFHKSAIEYFSFLNSFSSRVGASGGEVAHNSGHVSRLLVQIKNAVVYDLSTNMFKFNLPFLFLFLIYLPVYFYLTFKNKDPLNIFICFLIISWFLQSIFENSYPGKRHTIMFPVFIMVLYSSFDFLKTFYNKPQKIYLLVKYIYFVFVISIVFFVGRSFYMGASKESFYFDMVFILNCILVMILLLFIGFILHNKLQLVNMRMMSFLLILPGFYLFYQLIWNNCTYKYKNAMTDMGSEINNKVVLSGVSHGFRLYNTTIPILNSYAYQYDKPEELVRRFINSVKDVQYTIIYPSGVPWLKNISQEGGFKLVICKSYNLTDREILLVKLSKH